MNRGEVVRGEVSDTSLGKHSMNHRIIKEMWEGERRFERCNPDNQFAVKMPYDPEKLERLAQMRDALIQDSGENTELDPTILGRLNDILASPKKYFD